MTARVVGTIIQIILILQLMAIGWLSVTLACESEGSKKTRSGISTKRSRQTNLNRIKSNLKSNQIESRQKPEVPVQYSTSVRVLNLEDTSCFVINVSGNPENYVWNIWQNENVTLLRLRHPMKYHSLQPSVSQNLTSYHCKIALVINPFLLSY